MRSISNYCLLLSSLLLISFSAFSNEGAGRVGNGGGGILCTDAQGEEYVYTLDTFQSQFWRDLTQIETSDETWEIVKKMIHFHVDKYDAHPLLVHMIRYFSKVEYRNFESEKDYLVDDHLNIFLEQRKAAVLTLDSTAGVFDSSDEFLSQLENCRKVPLAYFHEEEHQYLVNTRYFSKMDHIQAASLLVHEVLYTYYYWEHFFYRTRAMPASMVQQFVAEALDDYISNLD